MRHDLTAAIATLLLAVPAGAVAECRPEGEEGGASVESCEIAGSPYRLLRATMTTRGTVASALALLADASACSAWQAMCVEERERLEPGSGQGSDRLLLERVSGSGISRRITVNRSTTWRLDERSAVVDVVGADEVETDLKGKRVRCLHARWTFAPGEPPGTIAVVQETVSDPRPPLGLGTGMVTTRTAKTMLETFGRMEATLALPAYDPGIPLSSLPQLDEKLPDLVDSFVSCQEKAER